MAPKYSKKIDNESKVAKASGSHIRVHFKHCHEIANAIKGKSVVLAKTYFPNTWRMCCNMRYEDAILFY